MAAVDIRARVYCSLGRLIDGEIADTYAQGSGLIRCRGSARLRGSYSPPHGTKCYFAVLQNGYLSRINRELRVLSSFTHPFTQITTVQLGCSLTYFENRASAPDPKGDVIFAVDDPVNQETPCPLRKYAALPITAKRVLEHCLDKLGLSASGIGLSSEFSKETFSFEGGYVSVLDGLLISENYCAFINGFGTLTGINYSGSGGRGPVLNESNIIRIEGINSGELPGEGVFVRYTTKKLKAPEVNEDEERVLNRVTEISNFISEAVDTYTEYIPDGNGSTQKITVTNLFKYQGKDYLKEDYDRKGRLTRRIKTVGEPFGDTQTITTVRYPSEGDLENENLDDCGLPRPGTEEETEGPLSEYTVTKGSAVDLCRRCGYEGPGQGAPFKRMTMEQRSVSYRRSGDITFTTEQIKIPYYQTPHGSVAIDREMQARQDAATNQTVHIFSGGSYQSGYEFQTVEGVSWDIGFQEDLFLQASKLTNYGSKTKTRTEKYYGLETIKPEDEQKNELNAISENGPEIEETVEIAWAIGSEQAKTIIEFTLPYPPDDVVKWTGGESFAVVPGNAEQVALAFGKTQNRLLLGNRNGVNVQIPYALMPPSPLSNIYINANGLVGAYRINGTSYVFNGDGIIASTDALFWGAVGRFT
jgi:hypothetical protein